MRPANVPVREVMQRQVVRLDAAASAREALATLDDAGISGAPVVDAGGEILGVVSRTDLAAAAAAEPGELGAARAEYYLADPLDEEPDAEADEFGSKSDYSPEALPSGTVAEWMTTDLVHVAPDDSLRRACALMVKRGVHRVLVLERGRLAGILSSYDVVRYLAEHE